MKTMEISSISVLWGPMWTGLRYVLLAQRICRVVDMTKSMAFRFSNFRCMDCGNSYHDKCADSAPKNCTKYKAVDNSSVQQTLIRSQADNGSIASQANTSNQHLFNEFDSKVPETRTHEG